MVITDRKVLEFLHDATVFRIIYDIHDRNSRVMTLCVKCDPDAGYPTWNGKCLSVRLVSNVLVSFFAFGALVGREQINSWGDAVSLALESELARLRAVGCDCSGEQFAITFHSGSVLEGVCQRIEVEFGNEVGERIGDALPI